MPDKIRWNIIALANYLNNTKNSATGQVKKELKFRIEKRELNSATNHDNFTHLLRLLIQQIIEIPQKNRTLKKNHFI